jgi:predicted CXXCH cytochrome family protein
MLGHQSGKEKAARVPISYYRRTDRWKVGLLVAGVLAPAVVLGSLAAAGWQWRAGSPGRVHAAHAAWENDCSACHAPGQPTSDTNPVGWVLGRSGPTTSRCTNCHAGPPHHPLREKANEVPSCSGCHREHQGPDASLARVPDGVCTGCHADLSAHVTSAPAHYAAAITRFDRDHPPFSLDRPTPGLTAALGVSATGLPGRRTPLGQSPDPGTIKFNHRLHLACGLTHDEQDARPWTLGDIRDRAARERYERQQGPGAAGDKEPVRLTCTSCHQLDAGDWAALAPAGPAGPARAPGAYMLPINYEAHCSACHPLSFDAASPDAKIPHRLQPTEVHRFLWGAYVERLVQEQKQRARPNDYRPLPGKALGDEEDKARKQIDAEARSVETFLYQDQVQRTERYLYSGKTTCGLCHEYAGADAQHRPTAIVPSAIPEVWFPHASFSHQAHRAVACLECHAAASNSEKNTDVLLPDVDNCKRCHGPRAVRAGRVSGGVRFDCVTCHRYHGGDAPLHGSGAPARGVPRRMAIDDLLSGQPGGSR